MKQFISILFIISIASVVFAQEQKSFHQIQSEFYAKHPELIGKEERKLFTPDPELSKPTSLSKIIYGFHPYWISDATAQNYYYSLLTHVAYFSSEVDNSISTTGGLSNSHSWSTSQSVTYAKNAGKKIHLTITMFSNHDRVIANSIYRTNLVNNIIAQLALRNGDGVNIDFEGVSSTQAVNFRTFINELGTALKAINKELAICLPAVDWSNVFPSSFFSTNNSVVDYYFIMLYGYWWSGSTTAGPVAPLTSGTAIRHVTRSIDYYISVGATAQRLVSGFPYYGYDWPVTSDLRMAPTTADGTARTFAVVQPLIDTMSSSNKFFDATYNVPWYRYQSGGNWRQTWYDDSLSLAKKYDSILVRNIVGTGMWALGYDVGYSKLWGALKNKFASTPNPLVITFDDFENSVGRFDKSPTYSGSTKGISNASIATQTKWQANNGWGSLEVILKDNTSIPDDWIVRLLSGGGSTANNVEVNFAGFIGFWMKTTTAPLGSQIALTIDDIAGETELSPKLNVINDGNWNYYQWDLQSTGWTSFAGGNGVINGPTVTLDAIMLYAPNNSPDWTSNIDDVNYFQTLANPISFSASTISPTQNSISFTPNTSNNNVVIVWNSTGAFTTPSSSPPSVGSAFAGGTLLYSGIASPQLHSGLAPSTQYFYKAFSFNGSSYSPGVTQIVTTLSSFILNINALIEGFYDSDINLMNSDTITVELRNTSSPYDLVEYKKLILDSNGWGVGNFLLTKNSTPYYIAFKHRNSIATWSAASQSFAGGVLSYNFTTDSAKAFGNNMTKKGAKWCIYSGDIIRDEFIDGSDVSDCFNDASIGQSGYVITDLTGDNFVDGTDVSIVFNNSIAGVGTVYPTKKLSSPKKIESN
jgi:spore germination protein YaaH